MAKFTVNCRILDNDSYDAGHLRRAQTCLDQLCDELAANGYVSGNRNNIAVDLACLCHVLELDPMDVASATWSEASAYAKDLPDLTWRIKTIRGYLHSWDVYGRNGVFDYLMRSYDEGREPSDKWIELVNIAND